MPKSLKIFLLILLAAYPVLAQYYDLGWAYISVGGEQHTRHLALINGASPFFNPWQYRVLCPWLIEGLAGVFKSVGLASTYPIAFLTFRFGIQLLLLAAAYLFYRLFVKNELLLFLGLVLLTYACGEGHYNSDLSFNTFLEVAFYLLLGFLLVRKKWSWILPLCLLAFSNRESSGLFPVLILAYTFDINSGTQRKKGLTIGLAASVLYVLVFVGLRWHFGYPDRLVCDWDLLMEHNFGVANAYFRLLAVLSIFPLLFLVQWKWVHLLFKRWFVLIVPVWVAIHYTMASVHESRLFLVPLALVLLPAVLQVAEQKIKSAA